MTYPEFRVARQLVAEEALGHRVRAAQLEEEAAHAATVAALRERGMVAEE